MKKAIYLLALALGATAMTASAQKNTVLVYGNLGLGTGINSTDDKSTDFGLNLGVGYQFNHNWTVGLTGGYDTWRTKANGATDWGFTDNYKFGPFVRYTQPVNKIFALWLQGEFTGFGGYSGTTANRTRTGKFVGSQAMVYPGLSIFFKNTWALNFTVGGLGFKTQKAVIPGVTSASSNSFGLTIGDQVNAGVSVNLGTGNSGKKFKKHRNSEEDQDGYQDWKRKRRVSDND